MPIEELLTRRITGIQPFNELPIDAEIWREAHGQHQQHRLLHDASVHRPGIVYGLDVFVVKGGKKPTIAVAPGIAIDPEGRIVMLSESVKFVLENDKTTYITISYEDNLDRKSAIMIGSGEKYYRLIEGRQVVATREPPKTAYLELARVDRSSADATVTEPKNLFDPEEDELNLLFRSLAFPYCYADGSVGEVILLPKDDPEAWKPNRGGLVTMLRFASGAGFHTDYSGLFNLRKPEGSPLMLYAAAADEFQNLADDQVKGLGAYLENGGVFLAEAAGGSAAFAKAFEALAKKLGAKLAKVEGSSPLFHAHHIFSRAPLGAVDGDIMFDESAGIILTTADYGAAWQGKIDKPTAPDSRERIRQSMEFGLNVLAYAARRKRIHKLQGQG